MQEFNDFNYKKEKKFSLLAVIFASVMAAIIGAASSFGVIYLNNTKFNKNESSNNNLNNTKVNINIDETAESVVEAVAQKVTPSVVGIRTTTSVMNFFGGNQEATGEGSGVIYSSNGYIITNYHVIADAISNKSSSKISVYTGTLDDTPYDAEVIGYNISSDLAVLKIQAENLTAIEIHNSDDLKVGQYVITVGNPGGLEFMDSVTYGVISGLDRVVSSDSTVKLIQTDAAINPGNSGGALVNVKGQLVGINSSKIVSEEFEGMGFAIESNDVKEICDNIIANKNTQESYIGISISEKYTAEVLKFYGFPSGAVISSVADNSPAQDAGLKRGDIITEFNNKTISDYLILEALINECKPGDQANIKIYRNGRYYSTKITIGSNN